MLTTPLSGSTWKKRRASSRPVARYRILSWNGKSLLEIEDSKIPHSFLKINNIISFIYDRYKTVGMDAFK